MQNARQPRGEGQYLIDGKIGRAPQAPGALLIFRRFHVFGVTWFKIIPKSRVPPFFCGISSVVEQQLIDYLT